MAFSPEELQIIEWSKKNGKSPQEMQDAIFRYRTTGSPADPNKPKPLVKAEPSLPERLAHVGEETMQRIDTAMSDTEGSPVRRGVEATAAAFSAPIKGATELLPGGVREGLHKVGETIGKGFSFLTDKVASTKLFSEIGRLEADGYINPQTAPELYAVKEALKTASAGGEIAGDILAVDLAAKGLQSGVSATQRGATAIKTEAQRVAQQIRPATAKLYESSKELVSPSPTMPKALGEVLQGKSGDVAKASKAFKALDTEGVSTYKDLAGRVDNSIAELSYVVDDVLSKDSTKTLLPNLVTKTTSKGGTQVSSNYVETALNNLKELYTNTADDLAKANIDDVITKARTEGLTKVEINDIARTYNVEFGEKAFSRISGEPLTSVNAQMYENIRSGLKDIARKGMGSAEAIEADKVITSLYNVKSLVRKNIEAVNKLSNRVAERGLLEEVGHAVSKYGDILTGGSIRGFVGGLLPRGVGNKVMNALDLEERLSRNLQIIQKALSGPDEQILSAIKSITPQAQEVSLLQKARQAVSSVKDSMKDQRGFVKIPEVPKDVSPASVAKSIGGKDIKLIQDYVEDASLNNLLKLQPVIEGAGLQNLDIGLLRDFFLEVIREHNVPTT